MVQTRQDRLLPNDYVRVFMQAIEKETGGYTLQLMLRNAGLENYMEQMPPQNNDRVLPASKFAALLKAIRVYFGSGARGGLMRIGDQVWTEFEESIPVTQRIRFAAAKRIPGIIYSRVVLEYLAYRMSRPDGQITVHLLDKEMVFVDTSSDSTYGQDEDEPVCWATLGAIQAALYWATKIEQNVEEISCRATGADSCKFRIGQIITQTLAVSSFEQED
jgi:predicted hydrocarbon binding protein